MIGQSQETEAQKTGQRDQRAETNKRENMSATIEATRHASI